MKIFSFLLIFFAIAGNSVSHAQSKIDSLINTLPNLSKDTNKLNTLEEIRRLYSFNDYQKSLEYANQTLALAKELKDDDWISFAYYRIGSTQRLLAEYELAQDNLKKAKDLFSVKQDYEGLQKVYYELASIEKRVGSLDTALIYYDHILSWDKKVIDHSITARSYNSIGSLYNTQGEFDKARSSYLKGMKIAKQFKVTSTEAYSNFNIGTMYMQRNDFISSKPFLLEARRLFDSIGRSNYVAQVELYIAVGESELGNYEDAEPKLFASRDFFKNSGNKRMLIECLQHIGINYKFKKEFAAAEEALKDAIAVAEEINLADRKVAMLLNLADVHYQNDKFEYAISTINQAIELNDQNRKTLNLQKDLMELKYKSEEKLNDFSSAFITFKKFKLLEDSLERRTDNEQFAKLEVEYEVEKKEIELAAKEALIQEELKYKNVLYAGLSILFILIIVISLILLSKQKANRLLKLKNQLIKDQAEKLKSLDNTKTKFFNNVAHELRTPLTLMSGHMESMLNERFGGLNENQRKSVLIAKRNANRLMDLISEILDLGKLESGKMEMMEKVIGLKPFLDRIFFTFDSLAYQFGIQLSFNYQLEDNVTMLLDEIKMEKVMNNLMHNAIKYTPREGIIELNVFQTTEYIQLEIKDTGIGIVEEEQTKVFERYFQTEDNNATAQGGTGIGLTLVKEFVELHDGKVILSSTPNEGSVFTVQLPIARLSKEVLAETPEAIEKDSFPVYPILEKKDKSILVVDDHKEMQQYLKDVIGDYGKVLIANDGVEALQILEKNKVDLMTVDLMMPNMDGIKLMRHIKQLPEYAQLPTIMLTARVAEEDKLQALKIGVNDYISKPFSQLELIARIANLLENKQVRENELQTESSDDNQDFSTDDNLIEQLKSLINKNLDNSEMQVSYLAKEIGLSEKQLTRNVKKATGLTPLKFIREIKLQYALSQLKANTYHTVAEVSYAIGIENPSHFTKLFIERFGKKPSEYLS